MEVIPLEVYATDSNYAVIKAPGRNYPGCVIPGDSLSILCAAARRVTELIRGSGVQEEELLWEAQDLTNSLIGRILHYQHVLDKHQINYPSVGKYSDGDILQLISDDNENT
jgi:hypothetical protein